MKHCLVALLFIANSCMGQNKWEAEIMAGISGYSGDLTQPFVSVHTMRPGFNVALKYEIADMAVIRAGISYLKVIGNDKFNRNSDLVARNLNFQSNILEGSLCLEFNLFESDLFFGYPYIFAGVGVYHFNPYTFDKNNEKTYLHPLSTEGQGLSEYPNKKPYSLTGFCLPFGGGWKWELNSVYDLIFEVGYRYLFTDYLDDVSSTYVDAETLLVKKGPKAEELAYRQAVGNGIEGDIRGNPKVKDWYYFNGIKLLIHLNGKKSK